MRCCRITRTEHCSTPRCCITAQNLGTGIEEVLPHAFVMTRISQSGIKFVDGRFFTAASGQQVCQVVTGGGMIRPERQQFPIGGFCLHLVTLFIVNVTCAEQGQGILRPER